MFKTGKKLNVFIFAMINVAIILSLRGLPLIAKTGSQMIFFVLFASILFLLPVSLVSAELATGWIEDGGIYSWVKEAFGAKFGFVAIWLQWVQNTVWCVTALAFAAGALAYLFLDPKLALNHYFIIAAILIPYWSATFINFKGLKAASWFTTSCVIGGTIFPAICIIIFGIIWILTGQPIEFLKQKVSFFPDFSNFDNIAFLAGTILLFAGMEVGAVHVINLKNPKKNYPKSIFIALIITSAIFLFGSFAIAAVTPLKDISLTVGIMQSFKILLAKYKLSWLLPVVGFLISFGVIGGITAWIGGPSRGLLATAKHGELPPFLQYTNKNDIQTHILWIQGLTVTGLSLVFLLLPDANVAYFLLTALTVILYLAMYILLYATVLVLRYKKPNVERPYKIPGGNFGIWLVAGIGLLVVIFGIIVGFFPPTQLTIKNPQIYTWCLIIGTIVFISIPLIIHHFKHPSWKQHYHKNRRLKK